MPDINLLRDLQALPLDLKVSHTKQRIREWVREYGTDGVCVAFSGGKDSTVLLHIVRSMYPSVKAVFVDTGLEYPEIRKFVKTFDNIEILRPKLSFVDVIKKYGYPLISKEVGECVSYARKFVEKVGVGVQSTIRQYRKINGLGEFSNRSRYSLKRYAPLLDVDFRISSQCCNIMKKTPAHNYCKETNRKQITAQMADESRLRTQQWLINGCNGFKE